MLLYVVNILAVTVYLFIYLALPNYLKQGDHCSFSQLQWIPHINNNKARPPPPPPQFPVKRPDHITVIS